MASNSLVFLLHVLSKSLESGFFCIWLHSKCRGIFIVCILCDIKADIFRDRLGSLTFSVFGIENELVLFILLFDSHLQCSMEPHTSPCRAIYILVADTPLCFLTYRTMLLSQVLICSLLFYSHTVCVKSYLMSLILYCWNLSRKKAVLLIHCQSRVCAYHVRLWRPNEASKLMASPEIIRK